MDLSASVLGQHAVTYITERQHAAILTIGKDKFDRASLANVACFNYHAAANLSRVLTQDLQVKDTRDVFEHIDPLRFVLPRLGPVSIAVLGAAFQAKGIGGETPLTNWFLKHRDGGHITTFGTMKAHEEQHEKASALLKRKSRRRA